MKLVRLRYAPEAKIKQHVTIAGSQVCENDIRDRYGVSPVEKKPVDEYWFDPGGFAFANTEPVRFDVQGINIAIKPEHLYAMDDFETRSFTNDKGTSSWAKIYTDYDILVVPTAIWGEILGVIRAFSEILPDGRDELSERLKDVPNVRVKK